MARAKNISPLHSGLVLRHPIATPTAVNHQDIRKPFRIPDHLFVGAKYFSPGRRPLVARNRMSVSAPHHLWHGRNIFRPEIGHWWRVTACLFLPRIICGTGEKIFRPDIGHWWRVTACLFLPRIICGTGEKFFAPTFAIVTPPPDHRPGCCLSST